MNHLDEATLRARLEQEQERAAKLAEEVQLLRWVRDLAKDAYTHLKTKAEYTGVRLPDEVEELGEAIRKVCQ